MSFTENCVQDLTGKTILVTGGNSGLGFESIKVFAKKNAHIVMAVRSIKRGNDAKDKILEESPNANIDIIELDLSSRKSIETCSEYVHKTYSKIDVLMNNAGVMTTPYGKTEDGLETQQGINHFGHFLFTSLVFDILKNTDESRIVVISSLAHKFGAKLDFDDLLYTNEKNYKKHKAYQRSKLENILFGYELARRVEKQGYNMKVLVAHPGVASTNLGRHIEKDGFSRKFINLFQVFFSHSAKAGAMPQVRAAVDKKAKNGEYYGPDGFMGLKGAPVVVKSSKQSHDELLAKQLWEYTEKVWDKTFNV